MTYTSIEIINARLVTLVSAERRTTIDVHHVYSVEASTEQEERGECQVCCGHAVFDAAMPRTEVLRALFSVRA